MAGVTSAGFVRKTETELFDDIVDEARSTISPSIDDSVDTVFGQLAAIQSTKHAEVWEVMEAVYNAFSENASGAALDRICALTGTTRQGPTYSTVTAQVNVDPGTYAIGTIAATVDGDPDARFVNTEAVTNGGGAPASFDVEMQADNTGPIRAPAGTLIDLDAPPVGVTAIVNAADADPGSDTETDAALRVRRRAELSDSGQTTQGALRAALSKVAGVAEIRVYTNRTSATDGEGRPGKSVEALVLGGSDNAVAQVIWDNLPAGIESYGTGAVSGTAVDDEGNSQTILFSRPTAHRVYARVTGTADLALYPGDAAVQQVVADFTDGTLTLELSTGGEIVGTVDVGGTLYRSKVSAAVLSIPGITVTTIEFSDDGATWVNADKVLGAREYLGNSGSRGIDVADVVVVA